MNVTQQAPSHLHPWDFRVMFETEVSSPENSWYAGVAVGHPPSHYEKLIHYLFNGGFADFRRRYIADSQVALRHHLSESFKDHKM